MAAVSLASSAPPRNGARAARTEALVDAPEHGHPAPGGWMARRMSGAKGGRGCWRWRSEVASRAAARRRSERRGDELEREEHGRGLGARLHPS